MTIQRETRPSEAERSDTPPRYTHPETIVLHGGYRFDPVTGSLAVPIHQTAAYQFHDADHAASIFALETPGHAYARISNPTCAVFEQRMAELDGGLDALAASTGLGAITAAVLNLTMSGDNFVSSTELFGGTRSLFSNSLARLGIEARFVDPADPSAFEAATDSQTRCYFGETLPNPKLVPFPIREVADIGARHGIPLIIDNTAAPLICRPFDHGAAFTVYSATKWLGGHGTTLGGVLIDRGDIDWRANPERFPTMNTPDPAFQGTVWAHLDRWSSGAPRSAYLLRARQVCVRDLGSSLSAFSAFMLLLGLETLPLRMRAHCENAQALAEVLVSHPKVARIVYPGLFKSGEPARRVAAYLDGGHGGLMQFEAEGGEKAARRFIDELRLVRHVANVGDAKSLAIHPASTTHAQLTPEEQLAAGVTESTVRLSVGIEHIDDIIDDVLRALSRI